MKRETFEEVLREALNRLDATRPSVDLASGLVSRRADPEVGIGGVRYGKPEKLVGQAVSRLAALGRTSKPIVAPSPDLMPPCF